MARKQSNTISSLPYIHPRGKSLFVRVTFRVDGKQHSKEEKVPTGASIDDVLEIISRLKIQVGQGAAYLHAEKMTFGDLLKQYKAAHPKIPEWYLAPMECLDDRKLKTITYADCLRFKEKREQIKRSIPDPNNPKQKIEVDRKPATIHRELETLRGVLLYGVRHGWLPRNPMTAGPPLIIKAAEEQRSRVPTPEEEARLLAVCVPPREHLRGLIMATRDTGLRRSALLSLDWSMVEWQERLLRVPEGNRYKRRPKIIGMSQRLYDELRSLWRKADNPQTGKIFGVAADFKRAYKTACRLAGIEGLRFNDFRHGFATDLMEADIPHRIAMKLAGHARQEIHDIYTNIDKRLALQVAAALDKLHSAREESKAADDE